MSGQWWESPGDAWGCGDDSDDTPRAWLPPEMPYDGRRVGLTRSTPEGAMIEFAASLDGSKPSQRLVAWVLLVVFGAPVVSSVLAAARFLLAG